jgi:hypothetical protein
MGFNEGLSKLSAAEADRPRYSVKYILESMDIMTTAQAPVMVWSRKLQARSAQPGRGMQLPRPQLSICRVQNSVQSLATNLNTTHVCLAAFLQDHISTISYVFLYDK